MHTQLSHHAGADRSQTCDCVMLSIGCYCGVGVADRRGIVNLLLDRIGLVRSSTISSLV